MSNATTRRSVVGSLVIVALAVTAWSAVAQAGPAPTATPTATPSPGGGSVLILEPTVWGGLSSNEAENAIALGFNVDVVTAGEWGAMTAANFASYRALILGDTCSGTTAPIAAAEANRAVWSSVTSGNIVLIGSDPSYHADEGGSALNNRGINFATSGDGTGLFATLSCYYHTAAPMTSVPLFDQYGPFTVTGAGAMVCLNDVHIVAESPALEGLTDADLSNWGCSIHEMFDSFPPTFIPLAIAQGAEGEGSLSFPDGSFGIPYILSRGAPPVTPTPTATPTASPTATSTATPTASPTATPPPSDCRCVPKSVSPGGNLATLRNVSTGGKGSRTYRNLTVKLEAQDVTHGSCPRGATSNPVAVSLRIEDDDGDVIIDQSKSGFVCVGQQPVFAKFWVSYEGPKHCQDSAVPTGNSPSHGDLFVTVATEDGSLIPTRGIVCKR